MPGLPQPKTYFKGLHSLAQMEAFVTYYSSNAQMEYGESNGHAVSKIGTGSSDT